MDSGEPLLQFDICHFCLSGLLDAQKCEKPLVTNEDNFSDPNKPFFLYQGPPHFLSQESVPYRGLCSCQISDHLNNSLWIRFEHLCKKTVILRRFGL